jgi:hypothetical protein
MSVLHTPPSREFEAERPKLVPYTGRFDGFHAVPAEQIMSFLVAASLDMLLTEFWRVARCRV